MGWPVDGDGRLHPEAGGAPESLAAASDRVRAAIAAAGMADPALARRGLLLKSEPTVLRDPLADRKVRERPAGAAGGALERVGGAAATVVDPGGGAGVGAGAGAGEHLQVGVGAGALDRGAVAGVRSTSTSTTPAGSPRWTGAASDAASTSRSAGRRGAPGISIRKPWEGTTAPIRKASGNPRTIPTAPVTSEGRRAGPPPSATATAGLNAPTHPKVRAAQELASAHGPIEDEAWFLLGVVDVCAE